MQNSQSARATSLARRVPSRQNVSRQLVTWSLVGLCFGATVRVVQAQSTSASVAALIASGDKESAARHPAQALAFFERALLAEPRNTSALWNASRELVDLGEFETTTDTRNSLYAKATDYARRAVAISPHDADAHFHLARALGRTALSKGPRDRVKYGIDIRAEALRTLELAPTHAGALHVMGVWNAEIMRLSSFTRLFARTFLGGKIFETASWSEATRYMEAAVSVEPQRLVHRLDMARVYRDNGHKVAARAAYQAAIACPLSDANDEHYRADAEHELAALGK